MADPSRIRLPDCSKLTTNLKNTNDAIIYRHNLIINFFDVVLFVLSGLVSGPSFMLTSSLVLEFWQVLAIKGLTKNPEIENIPVWDLSNIWRQGQFRDTKSSMSASNKMLVIVQNARFTGLFLSYLEKQNNGRGW